MRKNTKAKEKKTEKITIRVTPTEKAKLNKAAERQYMSLTEYMVNAGLSKKHISCKNMPGLYGLIAIQELCNYIEDNYGNDHYLEKECDKIWNNL